MALDWESAGAPSWREYFGAQWKSESVPCHLEMAVWRRVRGARAGITRPSPWIDLTSLLSENDMGVLRRPRSLCRLLRASGRLQVGPIHRRWVCLHSILHEKAAAPAGPRSDGLRPGNTGCGSQRYTRMGSGA